MPRIHPFQQETQDVAGAAPYSRGIAAAIAVYSLAISVCCGFWLLLTYGFASMVPPELKGWERTSTIITQMLPDPLQGGFVALLVFGTAAGIASAAGHLTMAMMRFPSSRQLWRFTWTLSGTVTCLFMFLLLGLRKW